MGKYFIVLGLAGLMLSGSAFSQQITGQSSAGTTGLDTVMEGLIAKYSIPGAALAISRNGILVYARGFGYADTASSRTVQPDSLFRIGSVSKTFTAAAIMKLVEQGKIQIGQSAFALLPNLSPVSGATLNSKLANVTVEDLLNMTGGWDRSIVPDPIDNTLAVAAATGFANPLSCSEVIQYMLSQPLQHPPSSTYAYSNFGYCVLGQILSQVTGMRYEDAVRQMVLTPLGIQRAKQAEGLMSDTVNGEVTYYDYPGAPLAANVYVAGGPLVPAQYGNHDFLASDASGSWVTTTIDLLRFVNGIDGVRGGPLLQPATIQLMETEGPAFSGAAFYGLGFDMNALSGGGFNWHKDGALPGTSAYLYKGANKVCYAVVFNSAPNGASDEDASGFETDYVNQIQTAITAVTSWPTTDQFGTYSSTLVQPQFRTNSPVVNAASFLPNITGGAWVSLFGTNLATATRTWYSAEFEGTNLPFYVDGVSVLINGQPAAVYYVSPTQIDAQAPTASIEQSPATVVLTHDGQQSATVTVPYLAASPAMFTYAGGGNTYAAAENAVTGAVIGDPAVVPGTAKAKPGDYVALYCNSVLLAPSGVEISPPITLATFPSVTIGGISVPVAYAGVVSAGLYQINVQIPQNMPAGNQPLLVTYSGSASQSGVLLPVAGN